MNYRIWGNGHPKYLLSLNAFYGTSPFIGIGAVVDRIPDYEASPVFTAAHVLLTVQTICIGATGF